MHRSAPWRGWPVRLVYTDDTGTAALFNLPVGITLDASGNVWVADTHNHVIRSITPAGVVITVAGSGVGR